MGDVKKTKRTETKKPYGCANTWRLQLRQNLLCKAWSLVGFAPLNFGAHCSHRCIDQVSFDLIHHFHKKREIDVQHQEGLWKSTRAGWILVAWFSGKWATFKTLFAVNARGEDSYGDECLSLWAPNTSWLSFGCWLTDPFDSQIIRAILSLPLVTHSCCSIFFNLFPGHHN